MSDDDCILCNCGMADGGEVLSGGLVIGGAARGGGLFIAMVTGCLGIWGGARGGGLFIGLVGGTLLVAIDGANVRASNGFNLGIVPPYKNE